MLDVPARLDSKTVAAHSAGSAYLAARCAATGLHLSVRPLADARALSPQWEALACRSLVPNIFYEPSYALPAALPFGKDVMLALVHAGGSDNAPLLAAWPFRITRFRWGLPLSVLQGWGHPFAALGIPLLDTEKAEEALLSLLNLAQTFPGLPRRAFLPLIPDEGPFSELLARLQPEQKLREERTERHDRAELIREPGLQPFAHLSPATRSKRRNDVRHLEKQGSVTLETITEAAPIAEALQDYLRLEAVGWKGRAGTAIPQSAAETAFFTEAVTRLAEDGRVRIDRLRLDGITVASTITYLSGNLAWYAKTSYNEDYARSSPGAMLVMKLTELFLADPTITRVDSCAPPLHPLLRSFWSKRFRLSNRLVELPGGDPLFSVVSRLERARPHARDATKRLRAFARSRIAAFKARLR